jgi:hypothetical protein
MGTVELSAVFPAHGASPAILKPAARAFADFLAATLREDGGA